MTRSARSSESMMRATELSAIPRYSASTKSAAAKERTRRPAATAAWPRAMRAWLLPVPAGPTRQRFSAARIHSSDVR
jgi:hypothetical protein